MSDSLEGGIVIEPPEGGWPEKIEFVAGSMAFRLVPVPGTPFSTLEMIEGSFQPLSKVAD